MITKVDTLGSLNFGPYVAYFDVHTELLEGLLSRGKKLEPGSANRDLAGVLKDQRNYTMEDKEWFIKQFQPYVDEYVEGQCRFVWQQYSEPNFTKKYHLLGLWINYMKEREYNPEHVHRGAITWVIYLKTPDLQYEQNGYTGASVGPGRVAFHYGEQSNPKWAEHTYSYEPVEGKMWMFPAQLRHEVIPYTTKGERISVSGNFYFIHPSQETSAEVLTSQKELQDEIIGKK